MRVCARCAVLLLVATWLLRGAPCQTRWVEKLAPSQSSAIAYDSARQRAVAFGGRVRAETLEWDGDRWTTLFPAVSPLRREGHSLVYDAARKRVVMFGGAVWESGYTPVDETWEWDGTDWTLRQPEHRPPSSWWATMAYDSKRERVVLYNQWIWEWDGTDWTQITWSNGPIGRTVAPLAYDPVRERVVLFGGLICTIPPAFPFVCINESDTWEWDGTSWTRRAPRHSPSPRWAASMAFDPTRRRMLLVGGGAGNWHGSQSLADTWEWDGDDWTQATTEPLPSARVYPGLVFDEARQTMLLFGGWPQLPGGAGYSDTWERGPDGWTRRDSGSPSNTGAIAYDERRGRLVMFGGSSDHTWEWDGQRWEDLAPAVRPPARVAHTMAYDAARGRVVMFGGTSGVYYTDTWEWDGTTWEQRATTRNPPSGNGAMAYDAARQRTVWFGGTGETWEWDGDDWAVRATATFPPRRYSHALAYDPLRQRIVLFGGRTPNGVPLGDTWEWNGESWSMPAPVTSPAPRYFHGLTYDAARQRIVLLGGTGTAFYDDYWEWDGTSWVELTQQQRLASPTSFPTLAYDTARQRVAAAVAHVRPLIAGIQGVHVWVDSPALPAATALGAGGCAGARGIPSLRGFGTPFVGNTAFALDVSSAAARSPVVLLLANSPAGIALGGGCTLLVDPSSAVTIVGAASNEHGFSTTKVPVPASYGLLGASLHAQAIVLDDAGSWRGLAFSNGLQLLIGE